MTRKKALQAVPMVLFASGMLSVIVATQGSILPDNELKRMGATAASAADHRKLSAHYRAHAAEHEADAVTHEQIAQAARKRAAQDDDAWDLARDAVHYAAHSREAAEALRDLATLHDEMAKRATN